MKNRLFNIGLHISIRSYKYLLMLYPPQFRGNKKVQMQLDHQDAYYDAWNQNGFYGILSLWIQAFIDIIPDVVQEYRYLKKEDNMREFWAGIALFTSTLFMLIAGVMGIAVWLNMSAVLHHPIEQGFWFILLFDGAIVISGLLCLDFWKRVAEAID